MHIATGTKLGPYEITGAIGAGGMGEVYRARDTRLGREVAIKVLPARLSSEPRLRERFAREARAISSIAHPHICTLFDIGREHGVDFLVMEYLSGQTLAETIARGPLPLEQVIRYGAQIADAVATAHRQGIVHRDLKPANIMITKSGVKVLDFGLASSRDDDATTRPDQATEQKPLTEEGTVLGTLQYMAPEQLRGAEADERSDIFALGTILYEMATGHRAFDGKSRTSVIASILEGEPPPMSMLQPMTPPALDHIVRKCLAKEPDDRLQSARDLEFTLREITQPQEPVPARRQRMPVGIAAAAALLVIVGAVATWWFLRGRSPAVASNRPNTIAVLPFANLGIDKSHDYLRLAIPDEITTILTYSPELSVRPFSASRKLSGDIDPQEAAKKLNAAAIVSGHLMDVSGRLNVTLEAIDVNGDKLLWRDVFEVASADAITMRNELGGRVRSGLLPRLAGGGSVQEHNVPKNSDAYVLYLRAAAMPTDGQPNKEALQLLEEAVRLEPGYAPAWGAIAQRAYFDGQYSNGGPEAMRRAAEAADRALKIDPDLTAATSQRISLRTEQGQIADAYREAKRLVERHPGSSDAHFNLSYVLRYGGALEESAAECNRAWAIDRGNRAIRSCSVTFQLLGDFSRAMDFVRVDPGSVLSHRIESAILFRQGKYDEAIRVAPAAGPVRDLLIAWRSRRPPGDIDRAVKSVVDSLQGVQDGEIYYSLAVYVSLCGRPAQALEMIRTAVEKNYCGFPAMDRDPMFDPVRELPQFSPLHAQAVQCHERFMAELRKP